MIKKVTLVVAALVAVVLFLVLPAWPGTVPASIVPEGVQWIAHLDMERFVATQLYQFLEKDGRFEIKSRDLDRWLKMDLTKDVSGVTVFGLGPGDRQAVVAVSGKLDKAGLLALIALDEDHQETAHGAYTVYSTDSDEHGAFVNDSLVVFSESRAALEKVLDTAAGKAKGFASSKLSAAFKDVPPGAFLSGVVGDLAGLGREINQSKLIEKAGGLSFTAQEKQDSLQVRLQVTADSPESAKNMADIVQGLVALSRLGEGRGDMAGLASLIDGLQVKLDGATLRLEFDRPSKEIAELMSRGRGIGGLLD